MAEVDIGSSTFPVFADVDFADEYLAGDVSRAVSWATRNADAKGRGLVSASRMLTALPWVDAPPSADAAPAVVKEVTAMLAADLLAKPRLFADASGSSNVKVAKAGSAQVEFFAPVDGGPPLPLALWNLLLAAGLVGLAGASVSANDAPFVSGSDYCVRPLGGRFPWDWSIAAGDYD